MSQQFNVHRNVDLNLSNISLSYCRQSVSNDRRSEPRVGKRVPYVIVYGSPGLPLIQLACRCVHVYKLITSKPRVNLRGCM